jgi:hypothetical protein
MHASACAPAPMCMRSGTGRTAPTASHRATTNSAYALHEVDVPD